MACEKICANAELFQGDGIKLGAPRSFLYSATQLVALAASRYSTYSFLSPREEKHYEAEDEISTVWTFVLGFDKSAVVSLHQRKAAKSHQHRAGQVAFRSSLETGARRQTQVSGKDEIRARSLICRKRVVRRDEAGLLVRRKPHYDVTPGLAWSRYLNVVSGRFIVDANRPTDRPTPISGHLHNTGQFLVFRADREAKIRVNITGGPLAYHYQFEEIYIHYGMDDGHGSEHRINNYAFPAEIQVYGFNAELYHNMSEAQHKSQGLVAISLMVQLGETLNPELQIITSVFNKVIYRGDTAPVRYLSLKSLLPDTTGYMTYEGSTTHPGCWETAVWLILNKPIYITARELYALRKLMQGPSSTPKAPLGNNSRPLQGLHYRTVRTNIDFAKRGNAKCPSMAQDMHYREFEKMTFSFQPTRGGTTDPYRTT
ncbi:CAH10 protein, partial [Acromyrmex heyeri]